MEPAGIDLDKLAAMFSAEIGSPSKKKKQGGKKDKDGEDARDKVKVILPLVRANNIEIGLKRVSGSHAALREMILYGDAIKLGEARLEALLGVLPTEEEAQLVSKRLAADDMSEQRASYEPESGMFTMLGIADNFACVVGPIRNLHRKIECMHFQVSFEARISALNTTLSNVLSACEEMVGSERLKRYLAVVLSVGNALHTIGEGAGQGRRKKAHGFRLGNLLKLKDTKAMDKKSTITLLDYINSVVVQSENPDDIDFVKELPRVLEVAEQQVSFTMVEADLASLRQQVGFVDAEAVDAGPELQHFAVVGDEDADRKAASMAAADRFSYSAKAKLGALADTLESAKSEFAKTCTHFGEPTTMSKSSAPNEGEGGLEPPSSFFELIRSFRVDIEMQRKAEVVRIEKEKVRQRQENAKQQRQRVKSSSPEQSSPASSPLSGQFSAPAAPRLRSTSALSAFLSPSEGSPDSLLQGSADQDDLSQDAEILLAAFAEHQPRLANPQYVHKLLKRFQAKGQKSIVAKSSTTPSSPPQEDADHEKDWREVMYSEIGTSLGVDVREHWKHLTPRRTAKTKAKMRSADPYNNQCTNDLSTGVSKAPTSSRGSASTRQRDLRPVGYRSKDIGQQLAEEAAAVAMRMWGSETLRLDDSLDSSDFNFDCGLSEDAQQSPSAERVSLSRQSAENCSSKEPKLSTCAPDESDVHVHSVEAIPVQQSHLMGQISEREQKLQAQRQEQRPEPAPEPAPAPAPVPEPEPEPELDDVAVLIEFYQEHEPNFANQQKVNRILRAYRKKASKANQTAQWRELMYSSIATQRGEDPRDYWQRVRRSDVEAPPAVVVIAPRDPRLGRERPPPRQPRTRARRPKVTATLLHAESRHHRDGTMRSDC